MKKKIAYIAPEIPALSATFVYNEILSLKEMGYEIIPISIHYPSNPAQDKRVDSLMKQVYYLYKNGMASFLIANVAVFFYSPQQYLKGLAALFSDIRSVGFFCRIAFGLGYRFLAAGRVGTVIREHKCDHIHANFAHIPTDIAMYASVLTGVPFSFTSHANDLFERGWLLKKKVERSVFTTTISNFNVNYMVSKGADRRKISVIRCGVDRTRFSPSGMKISAEPYTIGTIGRMVEKKGFDLLLKATSLLVKEGVKFKLVIAGGGPLEKTLRDLSVSLRLTEHVVFLGPMANSMVCSWLPTLDLFVLPCQQDAQGDMDGIPVVLMEAMLSGVPVVSTNISGIPELIRNRDEGLLVEPGAIDELADAMVSLLINQKLAHKVVHNAFTHVTDEFAMDVNVNRLTTLLDS